MNGARIDLYRRGALALSSVAVTTVVCLGAAPPAFADPYDDGDSTEVVDDSGSSNEPAEEPAPAPDEPAPGADEPAPGADEPAPDPPEAPDAAPPVDEAPDAGAPAVDAETADTAEPDVAEASQEDFDEAHAADVVDVDPPAASDTEVSELTESLESVTSSTTTTTESWTSQVTQWNSKWTGYDNWYRPVFTNPYNTPLQIIYPYGDTTRVFTVPPLQRAALTAPTPGVYSFTAVNRDPSGKPVTVSTGSFSGGGYRPGPGQPPPPKPKPPTTFDNVLVQLKYKDGESKPFRVKRLADLGDDPSVGGRRVLLDDETPAWGTWTKTAGGERLFEVTSTQQLPGLTEPSQGPLPGYRVQLTGNAAAAPAERTWVKPLAIVAAAAGVIAVGAVLYFVLSGRRRKTSS